MGEHTEDCAVKDEGPCTCGLEEIIEELMLEEADLPADEFA